MSLWATKHLWYQKMILEFNPFLLLLAMSRYTSQVPSWGDTCSHFISLKNTKLTLKNNSPWDAIKWRWAIQEFHWHVVFIIESTFVWHYKCSLFKYDYFISPSLLSHLMGGMNETNIFILGLPSGGDQEREILPSKLEGGILLEKSITSPREHSQQQIRLCGRVAP